jgi:acyl-CoA synthetase (AMP-forming)/AMP-acid ligase II
MVFRSRFPEPSIPHRELSEFVLARAAEHPDRTALVDAVTGRGLTYGDLRARVDGFAGALAALGIEKGGVVAIELPNVPEYAVVFLGTARAGATSTTLNPAFTTGEIAAQLADSGAGVVVTTPACVEKTRAALRPGVRLAVLGEGAGDALGYDDLLRTAGPARTADVDPAEDLATLPYSSGTTGLPKGVMLTHRSLVANAVQCAPFYTGDDDVALAIAPFFHIMGMSVLLLGGLSRGATLVTMERFDFEQCLRAIERHRVTCTVVAPPLMVALAKHPSVDDHDLSSLRLLASGGAPLGARVQQACGARLGCRTAQGWGMTEIAGCGSVSPPSDLAADEPGTVGWCVAGAEMRIVDPATGDELGVGDRGELWFRGPNTMKGYLHNPEATAATLTEDGWCRTGDVAEIDADGFLSIVDRLKDIIKYKGYQVAPAELEAVLISHPLVTDAAVVASPDEEAGEVPKAFLVVEDADPAAVADQVMAYTAERVAPYKRVRRYEVVDALPRTPSGKLIRRALLERERSAGPAVSR